MEGPRGKITVGILQTQSCKHTPDIHMIIHMSSIASTHSLAYQIGRASCRERV
jgi:hypothetical protein